jgi:hypothetical protein
MWTKDTLGQIEPCAADCFLATSKEGEIENIRPGEFADVVGDRQTYEKWYGGQEPEQ